MVKIKVAKSSIGINIKTENPLREITLLMSALDKFFESKPEEREDVTDRDLQRIKHLSALLEGEAVKLISND